jgi:hypothetical protein
MRWPRTRTGPPLFIMEKKTTRPARNIRGKPWSMPTRLIRPHWTRIRNRRTRRRSRASSGSREPKQNAARMWTALAYAQVVRTDQFTLTGGLPTLPPEPPFPPLLPPLLPLPPFPAPPAAPPAPPLPPLEPPPAVPPAALPPLPAAPPPLEELPETTSPVFFI